MALVEKDSARKAHGEEQEELSRPYPADSGRGRGAGTGVHVLVYTKGIDIAKGYHCYKEAGQRGARYE